MTLDRWLKQKKMSEEAFAMLVDDTCTQSLVSKWRRGVGLPSLPRQLAIERVTFGEVTRRSLVLAHGRAKAARKARGAKFRAEHGIGP